MPTVLRSRRLTYLRDLGQVAMKEKAMANMRTDKMAVKMDTLERQLQQATMAAGASMSRYDQTNASKQGGEITSDPSKATLGKAG